MISGRTLRVVGIGLVIAAIAGAQWARDRHLRKRYEARIEEMVAAGRLQVTPTSPTPAVEAPPRLVDLSITPRRREIMREAMPAFDPEVEVEVPFTLFATPSHKARLMMRPARLASVLEVTGLGRISFPRDGVPLKMVEMAPGRLAVFFREMFSGDLYLYRVGAKVEREIRIRGPMDAKPILRDAVVHNGRLLAILYDNERGVNEVVLLDVDATASEVTPNPIAKLPTLENPAGKTYEMVPALRFIASGDGLWIIGGTLFAALEVQSSRPLKVKRLPGCLRAQDVAVSGLDIVVLCLNRATGTLQPYSTAHLVVDNAEPVFKLVRWSPETGFREEAIRNAAGFSFLDSNGRVATAISANEIARLLARDLRGNHASGVMELGINNIEGRVAWSQIDFLNGLLDLIVLATSDDTGAELAQSILADAKRRLDIEVYLLDRLMGSDIGYVTKGFTVDRKPALFAVQTSRLLLLFNRYQREIERGAVLETHDKLRADVLSLRGHIEELAVAGPQSREPLPGRHFLRWPKGNAFNFDGVNVPYNHQNEWAHAVFDSMNANARAAPAAYAAARDIIAQFVGAAAPGSSFPASGTWRYWWGRAREGWTRQSDLSTNTPEYAGDKLFAWISFRSIDVMSVLAARDHVPSAATSRLRASIADLVVQGLVYPFVAASFANREEVPLSNPTAAQAYARMTAPSDLRSTVWALYALVRMASPGYAAKGHP